MNNSCNLKSIKVTNSNNYSTYPFVTSLYQKGFVVDFDPITIIVGENGVGKSTLLESIAYKIGFSTFGGNANHKQVFSNVGKVINNTASGSQESVQAALVSEAKYENDNVLLADDLHLTWLYKSNKGFFLRSETFATLVDLPKFRVADKSHGEGLVEIIKKINDNGIYILDEPESGLSPAKQIELMAHLLKKQRTYGAQFIIATHSPILMCTPNAKLLQMTDTELAGSEPENTTHFMLTKYILQNKERINTLLSED